MKRVLPHAAFLVVAIAFYLVVQIVAHHRSNGGWITMPGMVDAIYYFILAVYVSSYSFSVWIIKFRTGRWQLERAYLVAFLFAPLFYVLGFGCIVMFKQL